MTRADVREMLAAAVQLGLHPTVSEIPLESANTALGNRHKGTVVRGATVLRVAD